jgi:hypothetical protein
MILVQFKKHTISFTFENKKNRLALIDFWGLRHLKKNHATPLSVNIYHDRFLKVKFLVSLNKFIDTLRVFECR